jgi:hypothetical protein
LSSMRSAATAAASSTLRASSSAARAGRPASALPAAARAGDARAGDASLRGGHGAILLTPFSFTWKIPIGPKNVIAEWQCGPSHVRLRAPVGVSARGELMSRRPPRAVFMYRRNSSMEILPSPSRST